MGKNTQMDFIFKGKVRVWVRDLENNCDVKKVYVANDFISISPGEPHIFEFLEDTVMAEWWEPMPFKAWFYRPYRELVDKKIKEALKGGALQGKFTLFEEPRYSRNFIGSVIFFGGFLAGAAVIS